MSDTTAVTSDPRVVRYDPGPSGTAVAGLIVALIALGVALYAAFAPRQMVEHGAQSVMRPIEWTVGVQPATPSRPAATKGSAKSAEQFRTEAAKKVDDEVAALKADLSRLRADIASGGKAAATPSQGQETASR